MKPTKKEIERAATVVNDIAEGIDNGESRAVLRKVINTLAMANFYREQEIHSH